MQYSEGTFNKAEVNLQCWSL